MIELDDVFVLYRGLAHDVVALRGLSLTVAAGERVVVNGPSGSGKSTLMKIVTAELMPSAGRALVLGQDLGQLGVGAARALRRERIGIITQGSGRDLAPELNCLRNVALQALLAGVARSEAEIAARGALASCGVHHLAERFPGTLSGGEAQRVGVAAALASTPGVIVADEPTGELDRVNADLVYDLLAAHAHATGAGLLVVTHDARANRIADRVVTIRDGRVSSEQIGESSRLVVDQRGWVRLPEPERRAAGVGGWASVTVADSKLVLQGGSVADDGLSQASVAALESAGPMVLTAVDVSHTISGGVVVAPVSFEVRQGTLTVIAGPSGSGKTTLLGLLGGLDTTTSGEISHAPDLSRSIGSALAGFAEQTSVRRNVELARQVRGLPAGDVGWALSAVGISHLADRPVATLSGGERQRAGIARALVSDAALVLLDEPTSQLDEAAAIRVAQALKNLTAAGRTIVCTSHDPAIVRLADQVVSLGAVSA